MGNYNLRIDDVSLDTSAEIAIRDAIQEVEKMGADPKLTDVVVWLNKAKDELSDYMDNGLALRIPKPHDCNPMEYDDEKGIRHFRCRICGKQMK